jgi:hypothetical protein
VKICVVQISHSATTVVGRFSSFASLEELRGDDH